MNTVFEFDLCLNRASEMEIADHLRECDTFFVPPLTERVKIKEYSQKIANLAVRFEAWSGDILVGLLAAYCNDQSQHTAYITSLSVLPRFQGLGIASRILKKCIIYVTSLGFICIKLEVDNQNINAVKLYRKYGFLTEQVTKQSKIMLLQIYH